MQLPLIITTRDIPPSDAINNKITEKAQKLERFYDHITSCRVVIEAAQKHQHNGKIYNVRIDITVPGDEIVVNKIFDEDVYVAIRDAFNAAKRQLKALVQMQRGEVKNHIPMTHGRIVRLFPEEDYGFIRSLDGRDFYFTRQNVTHPGYDHLIIGDLVHFMEAVNDEGLQANRVTSGKHQPLESQLQ